jgi:hypothetical protein
MATVLGLIGASLILLGREGEFAGSAKDGARRVLLRRTGAAMVLVALIVGVWSGYA